MVTVRVLRHIGAALILSWLLGVAIFAGVIFVGTPQSQRYIIVAPVLCLLIALGINQIGAVVRWALPITQRQMHGLSAIMVILLVVWNIHFYFAEYTPRNTYGGGKQRNR